METQVNLEILARASHAVINRINYPKREAKAVTPAQMRGRIVIDQRGRPKRKYAGVRPLLTFHDCEEVRQTCALVLTASGAIYRDKLQIADWLAMFRASRAILRIDRTAHEDATDIAILDRIPVTVAEPERFTARRCVIARKIRYHRSCIAEAFNIDKSRKRKFNRQRALRFLRLLASQAGATGLGQETVTAAHNLAGLRMAAMDFRRYIDKGEAILERQGKADVTARNRDCKPQPIKSFDQLAAKRGRKVALAA
jgi:hypothetical protein